MGFGEALIVVLHGDHDVDEDHVRDLGDVHWPQAEVGGVEQVQKMPQAVNELPATLRKGMREEVPQVM